MGTKPSVFVDGSQSTLVMASYLNDMRTLCYELAGDGTNAPATAAQVRANLLAAQLGVNTDITSLASGLVLAGAPVFGDNSLKVPSTGWVQTETGKQGSKGCLNNVQLNATVAGNDLTITLSGLGGVALSASNPGTVGMPAQAHTSLKPGVFTLTNNVTLTVPNGATLGTENGVAARLWVLLVEEAGDSVSLAVQNCWVPVISTGGYLVGIGQAQPTATADPAAVTTVTAMSTASDSAGVVYGTAGASKPFMVLGCIDITQATAGVWAAAPSRVETNPKFLPGMERAYYILYDGGLDYTASEIIPDDTSIPQVTEGKTWVSSPHAYAYPGCAPDLVVIECELNLSTAAAGLVLASIYRNGDAGNVRAAARAYQPAASGTVQLHLRWMEKRNSLSHISYLINYGASTAVIVTLNGAAGAQKLGGALISWVSVKSISA